MKKIIALLLFALASTSFKTEAINLKQFGYGLSTVVFGTTAVVAATPIVVAAGFRKLDLLRSLMKDTNRRIIFSKHAAVAIASYYLAKKSYEKYKQLDAKPAAV